MMNADDSLLDSATPGWANRIVDRDLAVNPAALIANPANWRVHPPAQRDALDAVLSRVGWVQTVIVNRRTNTIVDGHLRVSLAVQRGEVSIPVSYVDLSDEEERLVLATFDPLTGMAETDTAALDALLESLDGEMAAIATLVVPDDASFEDDADDDESEASSNRKANDAQPQSYSVVIECRDEEHQLELLDRFNGEGFTCRALIL